MQKAKKKHVSVHRTPSFSLSQFRNFYCTCGKANLMPDLFVDKLRGRLTQIQREKKTLDANRMETRNANRRCDNAHSYVSHTKKYDWQ